MKLTVRISVSVALLVLLGTSTGCNKLKSRDQINKGVAAFKNAQYEQAVNNFQNAVKLDPTSDNAKLYLATSYAYQVVPNLKTPENLAFAQKALDGFNAVLAKNPSDLTALKQVASIHFNIGMLEQAKADQLKVIAVAPDDAEAYYTIGSIDWMTEYYKNAVPILAADGLTDDGSGNKKMTKGACAKIQAANTALVTDGLQSLMKAVELNPNYDDAMQYIQLTYRRKADLDCGNEPARKADMGEVDFWTQKAMGTRKTNEQKKEKKLSGGITM
jgi:tetratricopeptide (TPR) repeat protein